MYFFSRLCSQVVIADLDQATGETTENELRAQYGADVVRFVKCDVTNEDDLKGEPCLFKV